MRITINTGRHYTADGQLVTFALQDDGAVIFTDHARGIYGLIQPIQPPFDARHMARICMAAYDRNEYRMEIDGIRPEDDVVVMRM